MIYVVKANGEKHIFDKNKIIRTVKRAGVDAKTAKDIANRIASSVRNGETTHKIYKKITRELDKLETAAPFLYRLREAVSHLGPMVFERYVKKILEFNGFKCKLDKKLKGKLVEHEVDIIAEKNGKRLMVECKRHVNPHRFTSLGIALAVWARLEDLNKNKSGIKFSNAWIVTNTKFSLHAIKYAKGKNMFYTGWKDGGEYSLEKIISKDKLYPITILKTDENTIHNLIGNDILTIQDILHAKTLPLPLSKAQNLIEQAQRLNK